MKRIVVPVLGLAGWHDSIEIKLEADPEQQVITTWQVHTDDQSVLPGVLAKSFVGQSFASPLCPPCCRNENWTMCDKLYRNEVNQQNLNKKEETQ